MLNWPFLAGFQKRQSSKLRTIGQEVAEISKEISEGKWKERCYRSQLPWVSHRSQSLRLNSWGSKGPWIRAHRGLDSSQLSCQKLIVLSLRISHPLPFSQMSLVWQRLFRIKKRCLEDNRIGVYLCCRTLAQVSFEPKRRSQARLVSKDLLRHLLFFILRPLSSFGRDCFPFEKVMFFLLNSFSPKKSSINLIQLINNFPRKYGTLHDMCRDSYGDRLDKSAVSI